MAELIALAACEQSGTNWAPDEAFENYRYRTIDDSWITNTLDKIIGVHIAAIPDNLQWVNRRDDLSRLDADWLTPETPPKPITVEPGGEFPNQPISGNKQTLEQKKNGEVISVPFEVLQDDDTGYFQDIGRRFGNHTRLVNQSAVYSRLEANLNLGDGAAMFSATRGNLLTTNSLATAGLAAAIKALRTLTYGTPAPVKLHLSPSYLIVPPALEHAARVLLEAYLQQDADNDGVLRLAVSDDLTSDTTWYLAANRRQIDTIVLGVLRGMPQIDRRENFSTDAMDWRFKYVAGSAAVDVGIIKSTV